MSLSKPWTGFSTNNPATEDARSEAPMCSAGFVTFRLRISGLGALSGIHQRKRPAEFAERLFVTVRKLFLCSEFMVKSSLTGKRIISNQRKLVWRFR
jgi:hypothetical protein